LSFSTLPEVPNLWEGVGLPSPGGQQAFSLPQDWGRARVGAVKSPSPSSFGRLRTGLPSREGR